MPDSIKLLSPRRFRLFSLPGWRRVNDNPYSNGLMIFITFQAAGVSQQDSNALVNIEAALFIVPLYALIQQRSEPSRRSRIIAANNAFNALFMVVASLYGLIALSAGVSIPMLFLIMALMNAPVAICIFLLVPEFIMLLLIWLLVHVIYRVDKIALEKIPGEGPALLVCNCVASGCRRAAS